MGDVSPTATVPSSARYRAVAIPTRGECRLVRRFWAWVKRDGRYVLLFGLIGLLPYVWFAPRSAAFVAAKAWALEAAAVRQCVGDVREVNYDFFARYRLRGTGPGAQVTFGITITGESGSTRANVSLENDSERGWLVRKFRARQKDCSTERR